MKITALLFALAGTSVVPALAYPADAHAQEHNRLVQNTGSTLQKRWQNELKARVEDALKACRKAARLGTTGGAPRLLKFTAKPAANTAMAKYGVPIPGNLDAAKELDFAAKFPLMSFDYVHVATGRLLRVEDWSPEYTCVCHVVGEYNSPHKGRELMKDSRVRSLKRAWAVMAEMIFDPNGENSSEDDTSSEDDEVTIKKPIQFKESQAEKERDVGTLRDITLRYSEEEGNQPQWEFGLSGDWPFDNNIGLNTLAILERAS